MTKEENKINSNDNVSISFELFLVRGKQLCFQNASCNYIRSFIRKKKKKKKKLGNLCSLGTKGAKKRGDKEKRRERKKREKEGGKRHHSGGSSYITLIVAIITIL